MLTRYRTLFAFLLLIAVGTGLCLLLDLAGRYKYGPAEAVVAEEVEVVEPEPVIEAEAEAVELVESEKQAEGVDNKPVELPFELNFDQPLAPTVPLELEPAKPFSGFEIIEPEPTDEVVVQPQEDAKESGAATIEVQDENVEEEPVAEPVEVDKPGADANEVNVAEEAVDDAAGN